MPCLIRSTRTDVVLPIFRTISRKSSSNVLQSTWGLFGESYVNDYPTIADFASYRESTKAVGQCTLFCFCSLLQAELISFHPPPDYGHSTTTPVPGETRSQGGFVRGYMNELMLAAIQVSLFDPLDPFKKKVF